MTTEVPGAQPWDTPPADPPKPVKQPRQRRAKAEASAPEPARVRKPRAAKAEKKERAAPETIKVTLKEFAAMRVGEDDAKLFLKLHGLLAGASKGARGKLLAELGKVLG